MSINERDEEKTMDIRPQVKRQYGEERWVQIYKIRRDKIKNFYILNNNFNKTRRCTCLFSYTRRSAATVGEKYQYE